MAELTQQYESLALVDTLRFRIVASTIVPRADVRVRATVWAMVTAADRDHEALEGRVQELLSRFIDVKWTVVATERTQDSSGYERVMLSTSARVPFSENHNLEERARRVSREGLSIADPVVDYRLPAATLDVQTANLQQRVLEQALERAARFSEATNRAWRIGDIEFGVGKDLTQEYSPKFTRRENAVESGGSTGELLMTSERLLLVAQVTLKANP